MSSRVGKSRVEHVLNWTIKLAGLVITAPATAVVAGQLYADVPVGWRWLVQLTAVLLVEGVFLSFWLLLEHERTAEPARKISYAVGTLVMYVGLWVLAWSHGEGAAGVVFRAALGLAVFRSIWDAGVYELIRQNRKADRDILKAARVKRLARRLEIRDARRQLELDSEHRRALAKAEHAVRMERVSLDGKDRLKAVTREHADRSKGSAEPKPERRTATRRAERKPTSKREKLERTIGILEQEPKITFRELGDQLNVSPSTAHRYVSDLIDEGRVRDANGDGFRVLA